MISVFVLSFFVIAQPYYEPPLSSIDGLYMISEDNSYIVEDDGEYILFCDGERLTSIDEEELSDQAFKSLPILNDEHN